MKLIECLKTKLCFLEDKSTQGKQDYILAVKSIYPDEKTLSHYFTDLVLENCQLQIQTLYLIYYQLLTVNVGYDLYTRNSNKAIK